MAKEPKKMNYAIEPIRKILLTEAVSDGGTQKKAEALEGQWIRLNESLFAFVEADQTTLIYHDAREVGCACKAFSDPMMNVLCEHIIAFENLKNMPQLTIESKECRWLQEYLFSRGWYIKNRYLYPSNDEKLPEDEATTEPEVVAELPPVQESPKLDPVNEDKELDTGVDEEPEQKTYSRKCAHCGDSISGTDLAQVKLDIVDHTRGCPKNPANKKKSPRLVTQEAPEQQQGAVVSKTETTETKSTVAKTATVETKEEEPKMKAEIDIDDGSKTYAHPNGMTFGSAEALLDYVDKLNASQDMEDTKALMTPQAPTVIMEQVWSDEQIDVMKRTVAERATPAEFAYFLNVAAATGLNPFLREIYFMKTDKGQTSIITGRDGYLTIAKRDPRFMGIHSMEVCEKDEFAMSFSDGVMEVSKHNITDFKDRGDIIGAWACGRMDGQDAITVFASMKEYDKSSNAMGGKIWKQYTSSMMRKVAESMVLKRIAGISGLVTEAEIGGTGLVTLDGGE